MGRNLDAARSVFDDLQLVAETHDFAELRDWQVKAALNLTTAYGMVGNLDAARAIYDQIVLIARTYPGEKPLARAWSLALGVCMVELANAGEHDLADELHADTAAMRNDVAVAATLFASRLQGVDAAELEDLLARSSGGDAALSGWLAYLSTP